MKKSLQLRKLKKKPRPWVNVYLATDKYPGQVSSGCLLIGLGRFESKAAAQSMRILKDSIYPELAEYASYVKTVRLPKGLK